MTFKDAIARYAPIAIIALAVLVSVPRLSAVFSMVEPSFYGLPIAVVTGPAYGLATAGAALYVWHVYQERKQLGLAKYLVIGWIALLAIVALILTPSLLENLRQTEMATLLPFPLDLAWCVLLAVSAELAIGLTALASAMVKKEKSGGDEKLRDLRAELKAAKAEAAQVSVEAKRLSAELEQVHAELTQPRELTVPKFPQFARLYAGLDGKQAGLTPSGANIELTRAGFEPVPEGTVRGWLGKVSVDGIGRRESDVV